MRAGRFFLTAMAVGFVCAPALPVHAQTARGYDAFTVTGVQLQGMNSARFEACMDNAGNDPAIFDCYGTEQKRLQTLLNDAARRATARLSPPRARILRAGQRVWQEGFQQACFDQFDSQVAAGVERVAVDIQACQQNEMKRRIIWVRVVR